MASRIFAACLATQGLALQITNKGQDEPRVHDEVRIVDSEQSFAGYAVRHGRVYQEGSAEFNMRLQLFNQRAAEVERLNRKNTRWTAALNLFADRTDEEQKMYFGYKANSKRKDEDDDVADEDIDVSSMDSMPENFDWTDYSSVAFIRDQGGCGSCWAVTATTVLGAHSEIHGTNRSFSTQEVVDCVPNPNKCGGTGGCEGATVELAFQYAMNVGAREPEQYGAYKAVDGNCDWKPADDNELQSLTNLGSNAKTYHADSNAPGLKFGLTSWQKLSSNKAAPLLAAVYQLGPVAVALAANDIMYYSHGVLDGCTDWTVNHAVTMIGYGTDNGDNYWLIQNSWGGSWGEAGRFRLLRTDDEDNNCGTDKDPQAGLACEGETEPVKVCGTCGVLYDSVVPRFTKPSGN